MFDVVENYVFPFLQVRAGESSHAKHMRDARFTIPTAALLEKAVDKLDAVEMQDRDTKGDVYEYMLSKIATAGQNGQFRTPRHIIELMVEMTAPQPDDVICDPASGTCGFLVGAGEYIRREHPSALTSPDQSKPLPQRDVFGLRLRQHDAPHRVDEYAAPRCSEPEHQLPGLAGRGLRRRCRGLQPDPRQPAVRRIARL